MRRPFRTTCSGRGDGGGPSSRSVALRSPGARCVSVCFCCLAGTDDYSFAGSEPTALTTKKYWAVRFIVSKRLIRLKAVEPRTVRPYNNRDFPLHQLSIAPTSVHIFATNSRRASVFK